MLDQDTTPVAYINGTIDDCIAPKTLRLIEYWRERLPADGGLPSWRDFDLMDLYDIAAAIAVKDVIDGGDDFINRFWGTSLTVVLGFEGTGKLVSTYEPISMRSAVMRRYRNLVATHQPSMARGHISTMPGREYLRFELIHLPLRNKTDAVEHIISVYHFGLDLPEENV